MGSQTPSRYKSAALMESRSNWSLSGAAIQFVSSGACARTAVRRHRRAAAGRAFSIGGSRRLRGPIPHRISSQGGLFIQLLEICGVAGRSSSGSPWKVGDWICRRQSCRRRIDPARRREKCAGARSAGQKFQAADNPRGCNILFISESEKKRLPTLLAALRGSNVLTVADMDNFIGAGGMVQFVVDDARVRVAIDVGATGRARLKVSSKLLALARTVTETGRNANN